jgi:predicted TIM-barrel fold metal-dependent hydrolase
MANVALDAPAFMPIYEQMADEGHVLAVDLSVGVGQVPMMENILRRFPKLRVAIGHFGMPNRKAGRGNCDCAGTQRLHRNRWNHLALSRRRLPLSRRDQSHPAGDQRSRHRKTHVGLRLAADDGGFHLPPEHPVIRDEKSLSESDKRALLGENAARLYRLKKPAKARKPGRRWITDG